MDFLNQLNDVQRAAVLSTEGPQIIVAGAGSGKTRVLTYRLAYILAQQLAKPPQLLALTFTNKAAREMKERIHKLVGKPANHIMMGTFHSIFARMLRVEGPKIGYDRSFSIYDKDDSLTLIRTIIKEMRIDDKENPPNSIYQIISSAKNKLITPRDLNDSAQNVKEKIAAKVYAVYENRCKLANAMDFGDLLVKPVRLFEQHPDVLEKYQNFFRYLMVDEYQDTNQVQYIITKMLAAKHHNICVVGDDAQSIYAFRGAQIENILNFRRDYPKHRIFMLEQNYRSTQTIVNAANAVISKNKRQIKKNVFSEKEAGEPIRVIEASSEQDEAKRVANMIREQKQLYNYFNKEFAILYRTNAQSRALEDELRKAGLKYKVFGGMSFYQRKEVKDLVAYLRLGVNPNDEQALRRVINYPTRGIGNKTLEKITAFGQENRLTFWESVQRVEEIGLSKRATNAVSEFVKKVWKYGDIAQKQNAHEAASFIASDSGMLKELHGDTVEKLSRWENVQELLNAAQEFSLRPDVRLNNLEGFLTEISLFTDSDKVDEDDDHINLMTVHSAKGLEFRSVFIVGMEENLFPSMMGSSSLRDLEEERRLFYVAVTRAEERLVLSYAKSRFKFGKPQFNEVSRFLKDIDEAYLLYPEQAARRDNLSLIPKKELMRSRNLRPIEESKQNDIQRLSPSEMRKLSVGVDVVHQKFGRGKIVALEGSGTNRKASIFFQKKGQKVILLKFARLKVLG